MLLSLLLATAPLAEDHPQTYLVSIVGIPLKQDESMESFSFETWGVEFNAVCRIPGGWRIKAGSSATPDGELGGEGSHGATWFNERDPKQLRDFVLITLYDAVQKYDVKDSKGEALIPATFKGHAVISAEADEPKVALDYRNIKLTPAKSCPR